MRRRYFALANEPTGNLDLKTGTEIIELLRELNQKEGVTIISTTHDHKMVDISDRIVWIRDGIIAKIEERSEIQLTVVGHFRNTLSAVGTKHGYPRSRIETEAPLPRNLRRRRSGRYRLRHS